MQPIRGRAVQALQTKADPWRRVKWMVWWVEKRGWIRSYDLYSQQKSTEIDHLHLWSDVFDSALHHHHQNNKYLLEERSCPVPETSMRIYVIEN